MRSRRQTRCWAHDTGVLAATTAFGKTVVAAWLIVQRGVSTLVLVHRRQLLDQWIARLSVFLGMHFITARDEPLEDIAHALARTRIMPHDGARPLDLTRGLFDGV